MFDWISRPLECLQVLLLYLFSRFNSIFANWLCVHIGTALELFDLLLAVYLGTGIWQSSFKDAMLSSSPSTFESIGPKTFSIHSLVSFAPSKTPNSFAVLSDCFFSTLLNWRSSFVELPPLFPQKSNLGYFCYRCIASRKHLSP